MASISMAHQSPIPTLLNGSQTQDGPDCTSPMLPSMVASGELAFSARPIWQVRTSVQMVGLAASPIELTHYDF
jgi:hypothetical protein